MRSAGIVIRARGFDRVDGLLVTTLVGSLLAIFLL
jgi:hypothetical protein